MGTHLLQLIYCLWHNISMFICESNLNKIKFINSSTDDYHRNIKLFSTMKSDLNYGVIKLPSLYQFTINCHFYWNNFLIFCIIAIIIIIMLSNYNNFNQEETLIIFLPILLVEKYLKLPSDRQTCKWFLVFFSQRCIN